MSKTKKDCTYDINVDDFFDAVSEFTAGVKSALESNTLKVIVDREEDSVQVIRELETLEIIPPESLESMFL